MSTQHLFLNEIKANKLGLNIPEMAQIWLKRAKKYLNIAIFKPAYFPIR